MDLTAITAIIALNQATAVLGPVGASFADRYGYRRLMLISMVMLASGCFLAGLLPFYWALVACLFLAGLAKSIFDPSLQAFIGSYVPFENRGRFIGVTELAWAGVTLAGIPAAGLIIQEFSIQAPFLIIAVFAVAGFGLIQVLMPRDIRSSPAGNRISLTTAWKRIIRSRQVSFFLGFSFFMALGSDTLFVVYGAWLEQSYGMSLAAIGFGTILIGVAELLGELLTASFSDRLGLRRSVLAGTALTAAAYFLLPVMDRGVPHALGGLFLVFICFEFTIVTAMSLATELVPELRASAISAFYAIGGMGRVAGAFLGGMVWSLEGIGLISLISGGCTLAGLACLGAGFIRSDSAGR